MANKEEPDLRFDFNRPKVLDYCSITKTIMNFESIENLKYLHEPSWKNISSLKPLDLDIGFEKYQVKVLCEKLDGMLEWFQKYPAQLSAKLQVKNVVFVTYRGTLQTLMKMNYESQNGFVMYATKFKNLIFLSEDKVRNNRADDRSAYWGLKCEQLVFSRNPNEIPDTSGQIDSQEEFCSILYNRLNGKDLVYGGDLDGIRTEYIPDGTEKDDVLKILNDPSKADLIELKTLWEKYMNRPRGETLLRWYIQCMLSGVEKILVAGKNKNGKVSNTNILHTRTLPLRQPWWNSQSLMKCLDDQLTHIEKRLKKKANFTTLKMTWNPSLQFPIYTKISRDLDTYQTLSDDFMSFLRLQSNCGKGESPIKSEKTGEQKEQKKSQRRSQRLSTKEKTHAEEPRKSVVEKELKGQPVLRPAEEPRKPLVEKDSKSQPVLSVSTKEKTHAEEPRKRVVKKDLRGQPVLRPAEEPRKPLVKKYSKSSPVLSVSTKEKTHAEEPRKPVVKKYLKSQLVLSVSTKEKMQAEEPRKPLVKKDPNASGHRKQHFSPRYIYNSSFQNCQYFTYNYYPYQNSIPGRSGHCENSNYFPINPQQYYRGGSAAHYQNQSGFYNFQNPMHGQMIPPLQFRYGYNVEGDSNNKARYHQSQDRFHRNNRKNQLDTDLTL